MHPIARSIAVLAVSFVAFDSPSGFAEELVASYGRFVTPDKAAAAGPGVQGVPGVVTFGTASSVSYHIGPCDATLETPSNPFQALECAKLSPIVSSGSAAAAGFPVHVPTGALITGVTLDYSDTLDSTEPSIGLYRFDSTGLGEAVVAPILDAFSGGNRTVSFPVDPPHTVDNEGYHYEVLCILGFTDVSHIHGLYGVRIHYQLQVSPAPGAATFGDVPTNHQFFQFIEALAASGITGGCGGGNYCPDNPVTRGQMAVFFAKALGLHFPN